MSNGGRNRISIIGFTDLLAHLTANTSNGTSLHHVFTLIPGTALHQMVLVIGHQLN